MRLRTNWFAVAAAALFALMLGTAIGMIGQAPTCEPFTPSSVTNAFALIGVLTLLAFVAGAVHSNHRSS